MSELPGAVLDKMIHAKIFGARSHDGSEGFVADQKAYLRELKLVVKNLSPEQRKNLAQHLILEVQQPAAGGHLLAKQNPPSMFERLMRKNKSQPYSIHTKFMHEALGVLLAATPELFNRVNHQIHISNLLQEGQTVLLDAGREHADAFVEAAKEYAVPVSAELFAEEGGSNSDSGSGERAAGMALASSERRRASSESSLDALAGGSAAAGDSSGATSDEESHSGRSTPGSHN